MNSRFAICDLRLSAIIVLSLLSLPLRGLAAPASADDEAKYTETITKRSAAIVEALKLSDKAKADKVQEILVSQYRALNAWHNENDPKLKNAGADKDQAAKIWTTMKPIHDGFLAKLSEYLTPDQVVIVKDRMTYGKVKVTYDAYVEMGQTLTSEQKAKILEFLESAREEAMDGGSEKEKSAIFKKYKGRINNYLAGQGINWKQKEKEWGEREKAKNASKEAPATQPEH